MLFRSVELLFKSNFCEDGVLLKSTHSRAKEMSVRVKSLEVSWSHFLLTDIVSASCVYVLCFVISCRVAYY